MKDPMRKKRVANVSVHAHQSNIVTRPIRNGYATDALSVGSTDVIENVNISARHTLINATLGEGSHAVLVMSIMATEIQNSHIVFHENTTIISAPETTNAAIEPNVPTRFHRYLVGAFSHNHLNPYLRKDQQCARLRILQDLQIATVSLTVPQQMKMNEAPQGVHHRSLALSPPNQRHDENCVVACIPPHTNDFHPGSYVNLRYINR